jgi:hypothetical protein
MRTSHKAVKYLVTRLVRILDSLTSQGISQKTYKKNQLINEVTDEV